MNYLKKITIKNLWLNKKRTIATLIGIVLSIGLIIASLTLVFSIKESMIKTEKETSGNFHYYFENVPEKDISFFKENRNFESVYITKNLGFSLLDTIKTSYKPYVYVKSYDKEALKNLTIKLISGRLPENDSEILVPEHLNANAKTNYKIGDTISLDIGTRSKQGEELETSPPYNKDEPEEIINSTKKQYKVVGIIKRLDESFNFPGYTLVTKLDTLEENAYYEVYTRYTKSALKDACNITADILDVDSYALYKTYYEDKPLMTDEEIEEMNTLRDKVEKSKYPFNINRYLISYETNIYKEDTMKFITVSSIIAIIIITFTSIFCIKNSFDISLSEKIKQYGLLNSVGATSIQIKKSIYYEALILGIIGIPLGILCGFLLSSAILFIASKILIEESLYLQLGFSWISIAISIILGFIIVLLSSIRTASISSKITPIMAISNSEDIKITSNKVKSPKYIKKIFGIGGDIAYKNLKRNKNKYRSTIISIVICITIFIGISTLVDTSYEKANRDYKFKDYNIQVDLNNTIKEDNNIYNIVDSNHIKDYSIVEETDVSTPSCEESYYSEEYINFYNPAFKSSKPTYIDRFGIERNTCNGITIGLNIKVFKLGNHAYKKYLKKLNLSESEVKNKGILINTIRDYKYNPNIKRYEETTIKITDLKANDTINYYYYTDEEDELGNRKTDKTGYSLREYVKIDIGYVTEKLPFSISYNNASALMIVSDDYYNELFNGYKGENINETIYIDSNNAYKLQDEIVEKLKEQKGYSYYITNLDTEEKSIRNLYSIISILLYGSIIIVYLIGITNIFNTITSNIYSRSREFASLKSIGMTNHEFNKMISLESLFYGTKSLAIGITLGYILSRIIDFIMSMNDGTIIYKFPVMPIIMSILIVFISIICIMKYSVSKINKQNIIETIRNENI